MNYFAIILFVIWLYVLSVLRRGKLAFWHFLVGSVGMFVFLMIWIQPIITVPLAKIVAAVSGILGDLTGLYDSYFLYGILFINNKKGAISLYIDYECSGVIEIMAFSSLLWFYSVYQLHEKIIVNIAGFFAIFFANVMRIFIICVLIYFYGNDIYFLAHTIFGRLFFYACSVLLYFYVFTKSQIIRQKVGKVSYDRD